eukprot:Clim_evm25s146 gene=Clim_evmTU25s146
MRGLTMRPAAMAGWRSKTMATKTHVQGVRSHRAPRRRNSEQKASPVSTADEQSMIWATEVKEIQGNLLELCGPLSAWAQEKARKGKFITHDYMRQLSMSPNDLQIVPILQAIAAGLPEQGTVSEQEFQKYARGILLRELRSVRDSQLLSVWRQWSRNDAVFGEPTQAVFAKALDQLGRSCGPQLLVSLLAPEAPALDTAYNSTISKFAIAELRKRPLMDPETFARLLFVDIRTSDCNKQLIRNLKEYLKSSASEHLYKPSSTWTVQSQHVKLRASALRDSRKQETFLQWYLGQLTDIALRKTTADITTALMLTLPENVEKQRAAKILYPLVAANKIQQAPLAAWRELHLFASVDKDTRSDVIPRQQLYQSHCNAILNEASAITELDAKLVVDQMDGKGFVDLDVFLLKPFIAKVVQAVEQDIAGPGIVVTTAEVLATDLWRSLSSRSIQETVRQEQLLSGLGKDGRFKRLLPALQVATATALLRHDSEFAKAFKAVEAHPVDSFILEGANMYATLRSHAKRLAITPSERMRDVSKDGNAALVAEHQRNIQEGGVSGLQEFVELHLSRELFTIRREEYLYEANHFADIYLPELKMVVEVDGPWHFLKDKRGKICYTGRDRWKKWLVSAAGYRLLAVPFMEWHAMAAKRRKEQMMTAIRKLRLADPGSMMILTRNGSEVRPPAKSHLVQATWHLSTGI